MMARQYDVLLWGATGWTGVHLVEHFVSHYQPKDKDAADNVSWALVARNEAKLEKVVEMISVSHNAPWLKDIERIICDNDDEEEIAKVVANASAVVTVVGPYMKYGEKLVKACVENGTHYFDITGETHWVKEMITKYEKIAKDSGSYAISFCGCDSVPSDLSTFLAIDAMREKMKFNDEVLATMKTKVNGVILGMNTGSRGSGGGGGTMDTVISSIEAGESFNGGAYQLTGEDDDCTTDKDSTPQRWVGRNSRIGGKNWTTNFPMGLVNEQVVRRSRYLLPEFYGKNFSYGECMGRSYFFSAFFMSLGLSIGRGLIGFKGTRSIIKRYLPKPSSIPKPKTEKDKPGSFEAVYLAESTVKVDDEEKTFRSRVSFKTPDEIGWKYTAIMMTEAALTVLKSKGQVVENCGIDCGFITPACLGHAFAERLKNVGVEINIDVEEPKDNPK